MNYEQLKTAIRQVIKKNGKQEITGDLLQQVLIGMIGSLGKEYQFAGVATPTTNPGTPDQNVAYIAGENGTYTNFGGVEINNTIKVFVWNGDWISVDIVSLLEDAPKDDKEYLRKNGDWINPSPIVPKGGYNRALYEAAGAVFNEDTGFYELYADEGGLTDITEKQMADIYRETAGINVGSGGVYNLFNTGVRTNFKPIMFGNAGISELFFYSTSAECIFLYAHTLFSNTIRLTRFNNNIFYNCNNLKKIVGIINLEKITSSITTTSPYRPILEDISLYNLHVDMSLFYRAYKLSYYSIKCMVDHASNKTPITITYHNSRYKLLIGTATDEEYTATGHTKEQWMQINSGAQAKQISFADGSAQ